MTRTALLLVLIVELVTAPARADLPPQDHPDPHPGLPFEAPEIPPGNDNRVVLRQGSAAPFEGILFDSTTLVRWVNKIQWLESRLHLEHAIHVEAEASIRLAYDRYVETIEASREREALLSETELARARDDAEALRARIERLERRPPHRSFAIGFGIGAGTILLSALLGVFLSN